MSRLLSRVTLAAFVGLILLLLLLPCRAVAEEGDDTEVLSDGANQRQEPATYDFKAEDSQQEKLKKYVAGREATEEPEAKIKVTPRYAKVEQTPTNPEDVQDDAEHTIIQHGGHTHTLAETRADSGYIFILLLCTVVGSQILVIWWKQRHLKSFERATLFGLWFVPLAWSLYASYYRMLFVWTLYTVYTLYLVALARQSPLKPTTPRLVYKWFFYVYQLCLGIATVAYMSVCLHMVGVTHLVLPDAWHDDVSSFSLIMLFYGLYYGVLNRDCAVLCSDMLASRMGYASSSSGMASKALPPNTCAVCDNSLFQSVRLDKKIQPNQEEIFRLDCGHQYHDFCIRGWLIIGKRQTCAHCSEKVDIKTLVRTPWETQSHMWGVLLDTIRYLVVYNPLILLLSQTVLLIFY